MWKGEWHWLGVPPPGMQRLVRGPGLTGTLVSRASDPAQVPEKGSARTLPTGLPRRPCTLSLQLAREPDFSGHGRAQP